MSEADIIESASRPARRRSWVWLIALALLVGLGFAVARHGRAHPVAAQPSGTDGGDSTVADVPPWPDIPGVSRAAVEEKIRALGVSLTQNPTYESGQATDSITGAELHVNIYRPSGGDVITGVQCAFMVNHLRVDATLVARAVQCVLPAVPATDQAAMSAWLISNAASADTSRSDDIDGLRVSVGRTGNLFAVTVGVPLPGTA